MTHSFVTNKHTLFDGLIVMLSGNTYITLEPALSTLSIRNSLYFSSLLDLLPAHVNTGEMSAL